MEIAGTVVNGVVVPDEPNRLDEGLRVRILSCAGPVNGAARHERDSTSLAESLLSLAGSIDDLPPDMAENHDHYIHGTPKR